VRRRLFLALLPFTGAIAKLRPKRLSLREQYLSGKLSNAGGFDWYMAPAGKLTAAQQEAFDKLNKILDDWNEMQMELIELAPRAPWVGSLTQEDADIWERVNSRPPATYTHEQ